MNTDGNNANQVIMKVELITHTPEPDKLIAAAAKLCYSKSDIDTLMDNLTPEKVESFLNKLSDLGHESPVEHATFTFGVEGVSRVLLSQLTRHRLASYSAQSQRFVDKSNFTYIMPSEIELDEDAQKIFKEVMEYDRESYNKLHDILFNRSFKQLVENGVGETEAKAKAEKIANEDARYVLPNACDTKVMFTMNVRSLYNFFSLRCCNRAQWEIRDMANKMLELCKEVSPILFKNAGAACVRGKCSEGYMGCGHPYKRV